MEFSKVSAILNPYSKFKRKLMSENVSSMCGDCALPACVPGRPLGTRQGSTLYTDSICRLYIQTLYTYCIYLLYIHTLYTYSIYRLYIHTLYTYSIYILYTQTLYTYSIHKLYIVQIYVVQHIWCTSSILCCVHLLLLGGYMHFLFIF